MYSSVGLKEEAVMTKQTKLVKCGSTIFVYDFESRHHINKLGFELDPINGRITDLQRLLLTNFVDERLLVAFNLRMHLQEYEEVQNKLNHFISQIQKASGQSDVKYLAVLEIPWKKSTSSMDINLITNIEIGTLTLALDCDLSEEQEEEYFEKLWGNEVFIDIYTLGELLKTFSSAYYNTLTNSVVSKDSAVLFHSKLKRPVVKWNDHAKEFIRDHNLLDYPIYRTKEFFDNKAGFVISCEYSI